MVSFDLGFVCSSLTVTTQKANACSPWTPCGQRIETVFAKDVNSFPKRKLSKYTKHNTLVMLTYFRKQFAGFNLQITYRGVPFLDC